MAADPDDRDLVERWRRGDEEAARRIVEHYIDQLVGLARRHLNQKLAGRVDPEDIVQSAFRTFFWRARDGQFNFAEQDDMIKLLVRITMNKTLRQVAHHRAAKRNPGKEVAADVEGAQIREILDSEPTAEVATEFLDQVEHLFTRIPPFARQIIELRLQGHSNEEICALLGTYDKKIRRALNHVKAIAQSEGITPEPEKSE